MSSFRRFLSEEQGAETSEIALVLGLLIGG